MLTDEPFFQGSLLNLELASAAADLPCLRKDFMIDEYQIVEARAHCADAILLIAAALTKDELKHFAIVAHEYLSMCLWKFTRQASLIRCSIFSAMTVQMR